MHDQSMHHGCFLSITQSPTFLKLSQCGQLEGERETIRRHCFYVLLMYQPLLYVIPNKKGVNIYLCTKQVSPILLYGLVHVLVV